MSTDRLTALEAENAKLVARVEKLEKIFAGIGAAFGVGDDIADDSELDSKYGNEPIRRDPTERFWKGETFVGCRPSECTPEYLDARAKYLDLCAKLKEKDGKQKFADYDKADARRSRGWARRLRSGWKAPQPPPRPNFGSASNGAAPNGTGFGSQSGNRFGGGSTFGKPATTPDPDPPMGDDDFNFGHNAAGTKAPEDHDDDPPL